MKLESYKMLNTTKGRKKYRTKNSGNGNKQTKVTNMVDNNPTLLIIVLNVDASVHQIKIRDCESEAKPKPNRTLSSEDSFYN